MTEVGIHFEDVVVAMLERPLEPCDIGCAEAQFAATFQDMQTTGKFASHQILDYRSRTIGRTVVDYQNVETMFKVHHGADDVFDVLALVVGGDNYDAIRMLHNMCFLI